MGDKTDKDVVLHNQGERIIVLSVKDPSNPRAIKKVVCVPTQKKTIPAALAAEFMKDRISAHFMKPMLQRE